VTIFAFSSISDTVDNNVTAYPAYWANNNPPNWPLVGNSPNGRYVTGMFTSSGYSPGYLVDCSTKPPTLVWKADLELGSSDLGINTIADILAVDDEGTVWADASNNDGKLLSYSSTGVPSVAFTWTNANGKTSGLTAQRAFPLTASDGSIHIVMVPMGTSQNDNSLVFVGTKGGSSLTQYDMATWVVYQAFVDDHDDIWVSGAQFDTAPDPSSIMQLKRLTSNSSAYMASFSVDMGTNGRNGFGYFKDGHYVGAWGDSTATAIFNVDLTAGTVATDTSDASPWTGVPFGSSEPPTVAVSVPPNPTTFFLPSASDATRRTMSEILPGLIGGTTWDLDQWNAGDGAVAGVSADTTVGNPIYIDGQQAFVGIRSYIDPSSAPSNNISVGNFFLYYFGSSTDGAGDGTTSGSLTIRSWGFSLDGHDFYVLRLGDSGSFVYDLTAQTWSEWISPGRTNWRPHVGQNWKGLTAISTTNGETDVVCGDDATGTLWRLNVSKGRDERAAQPGIDDKITKVVTGGIQVTGRDTVKCGAVELDLALGNPTQTGALIQLEISDDLGHTFVDCGINTVAAGNYNQPVEWRSLGTVSAPGRIFRITDDGMTERIGGANLR
jgi:hypothetical protein